MQIVPARVRAISRERWMAGSFAIGSLCFLVGPFPGYASLVGDTADAITFFAGSIFFTCGGGLQTSLAVRALRPRPDPVDPTARAAFWAAAIQSVGTLFFNFTTYRALHTALSSSEYNRLVWRPDALGSICFLISGTIAYRASPRRGPFDLLPVRTLQGWWEPSVNLLGCVFFGISAVAGYVVPSSGSPVDLGAANFNTSLGAVCFLACALATLRSGRTMKSPRWHRLIELEHTLARDTRAL